MKTFLRRPSGLFGVCCLWAAVIILFGFVSTYHLSRYHPSDLTTNSEDPVELERQLRRRIESLHGERVILGDEKVAESVNWLIGTLENIKEVQGRMIANITMLISKVRKLEEETGRLRPGRVVFFPTGNSESPTLLPEGTEEEAKRTKRVLPERKDGTAPGGSVSSSL
jgi:hypothetical protein